MKAIVQGCMTETINDYLGFFMFGFKKHIIEEIGPGKVLDYYTVHGEKDGICITKYKGAIICKAFYVKGKLNGTYETWEYNGRLTEQCTYKDGKKEGMYTSWWHGNGKMKEQCTYKNDKKDGTFTSWHCDGMVEKQCTYKDGKREGAYTSWYGNGKMKKQCTYKNDEVEGIYKSWHGNGKMYVFYEYDVNVFGERYLKKYSRHDENGNIEKRCYRDEDGYLIERTWNEDGTSFENVIVTSKERTCRIEERYYNSLGHMYRSDVYGLFYYDTPVTERRRLEIYYNSFGNKCQEDLFDCNYKRITGKRWHDNGQLAMEFDGKDIRYYDENGNEIDPEVIKAQARQREEDYRRKKEEEERRRKEKEEEKRRIQNEEFRRNMPRSYQDTGSVVNWSKSMHPDKSFLAKEYGENVGDIELFNGHRYEIRHYINPFYDHHEEWSGSSITQSGILLRHCDTLNELVKVIQEKEFEYCRNFYEYHRRLPTQ